MLKENLPILQECNVDFWHNKGYTGKGVTVALLDSKCMPRNHMKSYHIDVLGTEKEVGHGTNVGFTVHEFAPDAKIYAFNHTFHGDEVYEWIKSHRDEIDLINVSLAGIGGSTTPDFEKYEKLGIPLVCASGNDGYEDHISYPAGYDWTVGIGAWWWNYNYNGSDGTVHTYSNGGADLDAVAPSGINMLLDTGETFSVQGTSFSSPSACGMLACYIQLRKEYDLPKITTEEVKTFIRANCKDVEDPGFDFESGFGLFQLPSEIPVLKSKPVESKPVESKPTAPKEKETPKVEEKKEEKPVVKVPDVYTVKAKDTISAIAKKYGMSKENICKWNNIKLTDVIKVGQKLYLKAPKQTFKDVPPTHSAYKAIEKVNELGVFKGYKDKTFKPDNKVTRAEVAQIIYDILKEYDVI